MRKRSPIDIMDSINSEIGFLAEIVTLMDKAHHSLKRRKHHLFACRQLYGTLPLSVRNRGRHVWGKWAVVSRKAPAAPAAHGWSGMPRS